MRRAVTAVTAITTATTPADRGWRSGQPAASLLVGGGAGDRRGHGSVSGKRMICEDFLVEPPGGPP